MKPKPSPELEKIFEKFEKEIELTRDFIFIKSGWNQLKSQLKSLIQAKDDKIKELEKSRILKFDDVKFTNLKRLYEMQLKTIEKLNKKIKRLEEEWDKDKNELMAWRSKCFDLTDKVGKLKKELKHKENNLSCRAKDLRCYQKENKRLRDKIKELIKELSKEENFGMLDGNSQLMILAVFEKTLGIDLLKEFRKLGVSYD